jgi:hypothetical protein
MSNFNIWRAFIDFEKNTHFLDEIFINHNVLVNCNGQNIKFTGKKRNFITKKYEKHTKKKIVKSRIKYF